MHPQHFPIWLRQSLLISVITLVLNSTGMLAYGQSPVAQTAERRESPTEKRIRKRLGRSRSHLSRTAVSPASAGPVAIGPAERRLRASLAIQRTESVSRNDLAIAQATVDSPIPDSGQPSNPSTDGTVEPAIVLQNPDTVPAGLVMEPNQIGFPIDVEEFDEASGTGTLGFFERLAIQNHPTLNAAISRLLSVRHEALQAGLHPNPRLGLFVDELGNDNDPGLWGAYLQSNIVRGNKLPLNRNVRNRQACVLELEYEAQLIRIRTDVRIAFYRLLIAQEKYTLADQLLVSQQNSVSKSSKLFEGGETPRTDLLQTELQAQKALVLRSQAQVALDTAWRELATVVGQPDLAMQRVTGSIESFASPNSFDFYLEQILVNSPELQAAKAEVERVRSTVQQQLAQGVPDYQTQFAVGRDSNSNHFFAGLQLQVPLQVYDRNQGNIAAAKSRLVAAQNDVETIELRVSKRLSAEYRLYQTAAVKVELLRSKLLPNAQLTLDLLSTGYPDEVSFVRLVTAQQTVIDITIEYLTTLDQWWSSRIKIEGLLLDDSLK